MLIHQWFSKSKAHNTKCFSQLRSINIANNVTSLISQVDDFWKASFKVRKSFCTSFQCIKVCWRTRLNTTWCLGAHLFVLPMRTFYLRSWLKQTFAVGNGRLRKKITQVVLSKILRMVRPFFIWREECNLNYPNPHDALWSWYLFSSSHNSISVVWHLFNREHLIYSQ